MMGHLIARSACSTEERFESMLTFGEGAHKRHKGRYYFSGWLGVGSDSELTDENSYNSLPNIRSRPDEVQIPVALDDAVGAGPDDPAYDQETTH